jgi:ATP-dependent DNA ligase
MEAPSPFFVQHGSPCIHSLILLTLDEHGSSQFNNLLFRRGTPRFCAFDLLSLNGRDLRGMRLIERKRELRDCHNVISYLQCHQRMK